MSFFVNLGRFFSFDRVPPLLYLKVPPCTALLYISVNSTPSHCLFVDNVSSKVSGWYWLQYRQCSSWSLTAGFGLSLGPASLELRYLQAHKLTELLEREVKLRKVLKPGQIWSKKQQKTWLAAGLFLLYKKRHFLQPWTKSRPWSTRWDFFQSQARTTQPHSTFGRNHSVYCSDFFQLQPKLHSRARFSSTKI